MKTRLKHEPRRFPLMRCTTLCDPVQVVLSPHRLGCPSLAKWLAFLLTSIHKVRRADVRRAMANYHPSGSKRLPVMLPDGGGVPVNLDDDYQRKLTNDLKRDLKIKEVVAELENASASRTTSAPWRTFVRVFNTNGELLQAISGDYRARVIQAFVKWVRKG